MNRLTAPGGTAHDGLNDEMVALATVALEE
jgi:hypothetical protein